VVAPTRRGSPAVEHAHRGSPVGHRPTRREPPHGRPRSRHPAPSDTARWADRSCSSADRPRPGHRQQRYLTGVLPGCNRNLTSSRCRSPCHAYPRCMPYRASVRWRHVLHLGVGSDEAKILWRGTRSPATRGRGRQRWASSGGGGRVWCFSFTSASLTAHGASGSPGFHPVELGQVAAPRSSSRRAASGSAVRCRPAGAERSERAHGNGGSIPRGWRAVGGEEV
jgi:hypothetical protein